MSNEDMSEDKVLVEYPCQWEYKIIGQNLEDMLNTIDDTIEGMNADLSPSNISKKGKYYSLNLTVLVTSQEQRNSIYKTLKLNSNIKFIL